VNAVPPPLPDTGATTVPPPPPAPQLPSGARRVDWRLWAAAIVAVLAIVSLGLAWQTSARLQALEQELVRRQQDSAAQAAEARMLARRAEEGMREAAAKVALLEARLAEVALQRGQLEELIQSLSRSRDENIVVDIEAAIRVALQQAALTGSAEPLVATLRQGDERLARYSQPRLEGIRRAMVRDLDRIKAVGSTDIASLSIKLDEAMRMVDELPLLAVADLRRDSPRAADAAPQADAQRAAAAASAASAAATWRDAGWARVQDLGARLWAEARSLVRVTRIDHPEAVLLQPENALFVRENLKLRLMNARLGLLSRQFGTAQADLAGALGTLERYFDRSAKRTVIAADIIRQVSAQARLVTVPRPDDTLAALAAAAAGR
jgi:uroporphyrin-3 C-methyltransferase